jgi:hypothetical protein
MPQSNFSLSAALQKAANFSFASFSFEQEQYKKVIADLVHRL